MKQIYLLFSGILLAQLATAQAGRIDGHLYIDGQPAPFAQAIVETANGPIGAIADEEGHFIIMGLPLGPHDVTLTYAGHAPVVVEQVPVIEDQVTTIQPVWFEVGTIEKKFTCFFNPTFTHLPTEMTAIEVQRAPKRYPTSTLCGLSGGVYQEDPGEAMEIRGTCGENSMVYYIDGIRVQGTPKVPSQSIESMKVINGGIPAQYGDVTSSIVVVETKSFFNLFRNRQYERGRK